MEIMGTIELSRIRIWYINIVMFKLCFSHKLPYIYMYIKPNTPTFRYENINTCWLSVRSTTRIISTICYLRLTYNQTTLCSRLSRCCFYWYITPRVIIIYHVIISLPIYVLWWCWTLLIYTKKFLHYEWDEIIMQMHQKIIQYRYSSIFHYHGRRRYMCSRFSHSLTFSTAFTIHEWMWEKLNYQQINKFKLPFQLYRLNLIQIPYLHEALLSLEWMLLVQLPVS